MTKRMSEDEFVSYRDPYHGALWEEAQRAREAEGNLITAMKNVLRAMVYGTGEETKAVLDAVGLLQSMGVDPE